MTSFLVLSNQHHLLPVAQRLRSEGHEVDAVVWRGGRSHRYERAWEGVWEKLRRRGDGSLDGNAIDAMLELAVEGQVVVLTDCFNATEQFAEAQHLFPALKPETEIESPLRLGGWFDGEALSAPHLWFVDEGAWYGGLGPRVEGAGTLVRIDTSPALDLYDRLWEPMHDALKSSSFRGLVQAGLNVATASGEPRLEGLRAGWPWLQWQAFLSEMPESEGEGLGAALRGNTPTLPRKFVVALPLSVPPWPNTSAHPREPQPLAGLSPAQRARVFWHDILVRDGMLQTAGLDGLVGVVRGAADSMELARSRALELAAQIDLPERQLRPDVAAPLPAILARVEDLLGFGL